MALMNALEEIPTDCRRRFFRFLGLEPSEEQEQEQERDRRLYWYAHLFIRGNGALEFLFLFVWCNCIEYTYHASFHR